MSEFEVDEHGKRVPAGEPTEQDVETLAKTRAALRREIGPPTDRDGDWQPMVSAGEVRRLLDALDEQAERIAQARREGADEELAEVREAERTAEHWEGLWEVAIERAEAAERQVAELKASFVAFVNGEPALDAD